MFSFTLLPFVQISDKIAHLKTVHSAKNVIRNYTLCDWECNANCKSHLNVEYYYFHTFLMNVFATLCLLPLSLLESQLVMRLCLSLSHWGKSLFIFLKTIDTVGFQNDLCLEVGNSFYSRKKMKYWSNHTLKKWCCPWHCVWKLRLYL